MRHHRRHFIKTTLAATASGLLTPMSEVIAKNEIYTKAKQGYELLLMATDWGFVGNVDNFCKAAKREGYDGVEIWWPASANAQEALFTALKKYDLKVGFLCGGNEPDAPSQFKSFKKSLEEALKNTYQTPLYINCHSGKDFFSYEENKLFIDYTVQMNKETGIPIYHETHRGRMLYAAPVARQFMEKNQDIKLTLDISHWCVVHESLLANQADTIHLAIKHAEHIHARVGHAEGPQVNDPRAPEWQEALQAHLGWWDKIIERKKQAGEKATILTEFGPPDYMSTIPYTRQALANQWQINVYMMKLLRERYQ